MQNVECRTEFTNAYSKSSWFYNERVAVHAEHFNDIANPKAAIIKGFSAPIVAAHGNTSQAEAGIEILGHLSALALKCISIGA